MTTETPLAWITWEWSGTKVYHLKAFMDATRTLCGREDAVLRNRTMEYAQKKHWHLCKNCAKTRKS